MNWRLSERTWSEIENMSLESLGGDGGLKLSMAHKIQGPKEQSEANHS